MFVCMNVVQRLPSMRCASSSFRPPASSSKTRGLFALFASDAASAHPAGPAMSIESKDLDGVYGWFRRTSDNDELKGVSIHQ